jgi:hypothetical protein
VTTIAKGNHMANLVDGLRVIADEPIASLSDVVESRPSAPVDEMIELVAAHDIAVGRPGDRAGLRDAWRAIVDKIRGRRTREVIDAIEVPVPWLSFHVPPSGKGHLKVSTRAGNDFGVKIKAVGSGWGTGRSVTLAVERDFQERDSCVRVVLSLRTRVTLYEGEVPPRADVLGVAGVAVTAVGYCPDCSGANEAAGAMVESAGEWIDLRGDPVGQTVSQVLEIVEKDSFEVSVGFKVPGIGTEIGIDWTRESSLSCDLRYFFPGGRRYQPKRTFGAPEDLPYWRWE